MVINKLYLYNKIIFIVFSRKRASVGGYPNDIFGPKMCQLYLAIIYGHFKAKI